MVRNCPPPKLRALGGVAHDVDGGKHEDAATGRDAAGGRRGETEGAQRVGTVAGWRQNNLWEIEPT